MAEDVVKSVGRVFEVLELFSDSKEPLNAKEVERRLNYPQSSTLALLKSLVKLGYLSFDRIERSYFPTIRAAHLGNWLETSLFGDAEIGALMNEINQRSGESVALSCQNDFSMQFLQLIPGQFVGIPAFAAGDTVPLFASAIGIAAVMNLADGDIAKLVARANQRANHANVELRLVMDRVAIARAAGHAGSIADDAIAIGALAWPMTSADCQLSVVLSVAGPAERITARTGEIVEIVDSAIRSHLR